MSKIDTITLHIGHTVKVEVTDALERAIQTARTARNAGDTKLAAVRRVYPAIAHLPRQAIWYAIIHGVSLSSRGAVTYYYMMRREAGRR